MSIRDDMRVAMYDRLLTEFPAVFGASVSVSLENQKFEQPKEEPFLIAYFRYQPSKRAAIGTTQKFNRHRGFFVVECVVPQDSGAKTMWDMCSAVEEIFNAETFTIGSGSVATTYVPTAVSEGVAENGFYYAMVVVPFHIDSKEA